MNGKEKIKTVGVSGIVGCLLVAGIFIPYGWTEISVSPMVHGKQMAQGIPGVPKRENGNFPDNQRTVPRTNDSEMVIKPDTPPDPDAVVTPPIIDPEMAVDPATGQPMTSDKLERLTPEELEKDGPGKGKK